MQYQIMLTFPDVADVFEIAEILAPLKGNEKVKFAAAQPRPTPLVSSGADRPIPERITSLQRKPTGQPPTGAK